MFQEHTRVCASKEEQKLLVGSRKTMKHIEISSLKEMEEKKIAELLR